MTEDLDIASMRAAAQVLRQYEDFASFAKLHGGNATTRCNIHSALWEVYPDRLIFHIHADRFLRGMVRAIVGTLLDVGKNKLSLSGFADVIEAQDRSAASMNAAAHGLYLSEVHYPQHALIPLEPAPNEQ
jgi:tRNA pseudouridine38-40 synthase